MRQSYRVGLALMVFAGVLARAEAQCPDVNSATVFEAEDGCPDRNAPGQQNGGCYLGMPTFQAQELPLGAKVWGNVGDDDIDAYTFTLTGTNYIRIECNVTVVNHTGQFGIQWVGPPEDTCRQMGYGGEVLRTFQGTGCFTDVKDVYLGPGRYALWLGASGGGCRPYTISITSLARPGPVPQEVCGSAVVVPDGGVFRTPAVNLLGLVAEPEVATTRPMMATVWYEHVAVRDGTLSVSGPPAGENAAQPGLVAVSWYESLDGGCENLTEVASTSTIQGRAAVQVKAGRTYYAQVGHDYFRTMRSDKAQLVLDWLPPQPIPVNVKGWVEQGDAGALPAGRQVPITSERLDAIYGSLSSPDDQDLYEVNVCNPQGTFLATTSETPFGRTTWDTQLYLFTLDGHGVAQNDDINRLQGVRQSGLDGMFLPGPGRYIIALTTNDVEARTAQGAKIFNKTADYTGADGPGAASPIASWYFQRKWHAMTSLNYQGAYVISFYSMCPIEACGTADFNGDGDFGTDQDIEAFFACLGGTCCAACFEGGADFNRDGDFGTDQDIEAFFRVLAGGAC